MSLKRKAPSFRKLCPASSRASAAARGASKKTDTHPELVLRRALWRLGLRYRTHDAMVPGRPDVVFARARLAIFCDGDFWHGRELGARVASLRTGHNPAYWVSKIRRNVERDRRNVRVLEQLGWRVLRFWESDILRDVHKIAQTVRTELQKSTLSRPVSRFASETVVTMKRCV